MLTFFPLSVVRITSSCSFFLQHHSTCSSSPTCTHLCQSHQRLAHNFLLSSFSSPSNRQTLFTLSLSLISVISASFQFRHIGQYIPIAVATSLKPSNQETRATPSTLLKVVSPATPVFRTFTFKIADFHFLAH